MVAWTRTRPSRWLAWALGLGFALSCCTSLRAQGPAAPSYASRAAPPSGVAAPGVPTGPRTPPVSAGDGLAPPGGPFVAPPDGVMMAPPDGPMMAPPDGPPGLDVDAAGHVITPPPPPGSLNVFQVIGQSIFGSTNAGEGWAPLSLATFFTQGWNTPYAEAPLGTNEAPKQLWQNCVTGIFGRLMYVDFYYTNHMNPVPGLFLTPQPWAPIHPLKTNGNEYFASYNALIPVNARLEFQITAPFIASNHVDTNGNWDGSFGDLTFWARFHLIEQRNFSMVAYIAERIPTGNFNNGDNINYITPSIEGWWNFAPKWVVRGGTGINVVTNHPTTVAQVYFTNWAIGRYLTTNTTPVFKDLAVFTSVSTLSDVSGQAGNVNDIYVSPGTRFSFDKKDMISANFAVQIPVSGPQSYVWQPSFALVMKY